MSWVCTVIGTVVKLWIVRLMPTESYLMSQNEQKNAHYHKIGLIKGKAFFALSPYCVEVPGLNAVDFFFFVWRLPVLPMSECVLLWFFGFLPKSRN